MNFLCKIGIHRKKRELEPECIPGFIICDKCKLTNAETEYDGVFVNFYRFKVLSFPEFIKWKIKQMNKYFAFRFNNLHNKGLKAFYLIPIFHILLYPKRTGTKDFWRLEFALKFIKWRLAFNISNKAYMLF